MALNVNGNNEIPRQNQVGTETVQGTMGNRTPNSVMSQAENSVEPQAPINRKLQSASLDYTTFDKNRRAEANTLASSAINEVYDLARTHNNDFPLRPYVINYDTFPDPQGFKKDNFGSKDRAFNAWQTAVRDWVEDCKQDMDARRSTNLQDINNNIINTYVGLYTKLNLTKAYIVSVVENCHYDVAMIRERLDNAVQELLQDGQRTRNTVRNEGNQTRDLVASSTSETAGLIRNEHQNTRDIITTVLNPPPAEEEPAGPGAEPPIANNGDDEPVGHEPAPDEPGTPNPETPNGSIPPSVPLPRELPSLDEPRTPLDPDAPEIL